MYVFCVAPATFAQLFPEESHCCHWYAKVVGEFDHVPLLVLERLAFLRLAADRRQCLILRCGCDAR